MELVLVSLSDSYLILNSISISTSGLSLSFALYCLLITSTTDYYSKKKYKQFYLKKNIVKITKSLFLFLFLFIFYFEKIRLGFGVMLHVNVTNSHMTRPSVTHQSHGIIEDSKRF